MLGGLLPIPAAIIAVMFARDLAFPDRSRVPLMLVYLFAASLLVLDLLARLLGWRRIVARARQPNVLTPNGYAVAPRRRWRDALEALFSPAAGGQYFHVVPAWLAAPALVLVITL